MNELINDKAVCRTAPARPGVLILCNMLYLVGLIHFFKDHLDGLSDPNYLS